MSAVVRICSAVTGLLSSLWKVRIALSLRKFAHHPIALPIRITVRQSEATGFTFMFKRIQDEKHAVILTLMQPCGRRVGNLHSVRCGDSLISESKNSSSERK